VRCSRYGESGVVCESSRETREFHAKKIHVRHKRVQYAPTSSGVGSVEVLGRQYLWRGKFEGVTRSYVDHAAPLSDRPGPALVDREGRRGGAADAALASVEKLLRIDA
jgi:hypothetical protein